MGKYVDADIIFRTAELTEEDMYFKKMMEEIPKHNHDERAMSMDNVIYRKREFIIMEVHDGSRKGFIVYNTKKPFKEGHTHLKSLDMAKVLINNVINKKVPKSHNEYIISSHIRVAKDEKYIRQLTELMETRKHKTKQDYYNPKSTK